MVRSLVAFPLLVASGCAILLDLGGYEEETSAAPGGQGGMGGVGGDGGAGGAGGTDPTVEVTAKWVTPLSGTGAVTMGGLVVDGVGNTFVCGTHEGALFDDALLTDPGMGNIFVSVLNGDGEVGETISAGDISPQYCADITVDGQNRPHFTGAVSGTTTIGDDTASLVGPFVFVARLTAALTDASLFVTTGGSGTQSASGLAVQGQAVHIGGGFDQTFDSAMMPIFAGTQPSAFALRLFEPDFEWTIGFTSNTGPHFVSGVDVLSDEAGVFVGGFRGDFNGDEFPALPSDEGSRDGFIAIVDRVGGAVRKVIAVAGPLNEAVNDVAVDENDNIIVVGPYRGAFNIEGEGPTDPADATGIFVAKLTEQEVMWVRTFDGNADQTPRAVAVRGDDIWVTGTNSGTVEFGGTQVTSGTQGGFVLMLDGVAGDVRFAAPIEAVANGMVIPNEISIGPTTADKAHGDAHIGVTFRGDVRLLGAVVASSAKLDAGAVIALRVD